jgi:hypothetical protein
MGRWAPPAAPLGASEQWPRYEALLQRRSRLGELACTLPGSMATSGSGYGAHDHRVGARVVRIVRRVLSRSSHPSPTTRSFYSSSSMTRWPHGSRSRQAVRNLALTVVALILLPGSQEI